MVSAAKLRKAQNASHQMRPYAQKLDEILINLVSGLDGGSDSVFASVREQGRIAIVLVASNGGLCGAFNSNVAKYGINLAREVYPEDLAMGNIDFMTIGKKAADQLKSRKFQSIKSYDSVYVGLTYEKASDIALELMDIYAEGKYRNVVLVYNQFRNASTQSVAAMQYLPIILPKQVKSDAYKKDYIFEPNKEEILSSLIPLSLKTKVYSILLESVASEHGARMTAMHKATDNAAELLKNLRIQFNKIRQSSITNEILEIVGGANALKG